MFDRRPKITRYGSKAAASEKAAGAAAATAATETANLKQRAVTFERRPGGFVSGRTQQPLGESLREHCFSYERTNESQRLVECAEESPVCVKLWPGQEKSDAGPPTAGCRVGALRPALIEI